jgi:hypothetical protein
MAPQGDCSGSQLCPRASRARLTCPVDWGTMRQVAGMVPIPDRHIASPKRGCERTEEAEGDDDTYD